MIEFYFSFTHIKHIFFNLQPILTKYIKGTSSQVDCLTALEHHCKDESEFVPVAMKTIHFLYELDILGEEGILKWFTTDEEGFPGFSQGFRAKVKPFIDWLEESDEDDDDSEEESD